MTDTNHTDPKTFGISLRVLGNEVFAINITVGNDANNWVAIGLVSTLGFLSLLGAYGEKAVSAYHSLVG